MKAFVFQKGDLMRVSELLSHGLAPQADVGGVLEFNLPDLDPDTFEIFHLFVIHGHIFSNLDNDYQPTQPEEPFRHVDLEWLRLANAWVLGDFLTSCSFKDAIVDAITAKLIEEQRYPINLHEIIYPKSKKTSAIRKLLVDIAIWSFQDVDLERQGFKEGMAEYYYDVVVALNGLKLAERSKVDISALEDTCRYHEHGQSGKPCYKTMS